MPYTQKDRAKLIEAAKARIEDGNNEMLALYRDDEALDKKLEERSALRKKERENGLSAAENQRLLTLNNDPTVKEWLELYNAERDLVKEIKNLEKTGDHCVDADRDVQDGSPSSVIAPHAGQHAFSALRSEPLSNAALLPSTSVPTESLNLEPGILSYKRQFSVVSPATVNPVHGGEKSLSFSAVSSSVGEFLKKMLSIAPPPQPETASAPTARKIEAIKKD